MSNPTLEFGWSRQAALKLDLSFKLEEGRIHESAATIESGHV